jgi:hypothetical protein
MQPATPVARRLRDVSLVNDPSRILDLSVRLWPYCGHIVAPSVSSNRLARFARHNCLSLPMHTAKIPPEDPAAPRIAAVLAMQAGHIDLTKRARIPLCSLPLSGRAPTLRKTYRWSDLNDHGNYLIATLDG